MRKFRKLYEFKKTKLLQVKIGIKLFNKIFLANQINESVNYFQYLLLIILILTIAFLAFLYQCSIAGGKYKFFNGYDKLVIPLLARLGSNQSISSVSNNNPQKSKNLNSNSTLLSKARRSSGVEIDNKEWVWLPKQKIIDNYSIGLNFYYEFNLNILEKDNIFFSLKATKLFFKI